MKKILIATTALVATAGVASAQDLGVNLSGSAEMGIFGGSRYDTATVEAKTQFMTDLDVSFSMSGQADNGLTFGAQIDLDEAADSGDVGVFEDPADQGGENMFVSFGGATLTMGDTDGAYDKRMQEVALVGGSLRDDETEHAGYSGNSGLDGGGITGSDGQIARFDYAFDAFGVSVSMEQDDNGQNTNAIYGVGFSYDAALAGLNIGIGLGYQSQTDNRNILGMSLDTEFANGVSAALNFDRIDYDASGMDNQTHAAIGFGYEMNNLALGINYGKYNNVGGVADAEKSGFGVVANYDMGGGIVAQVGYGKSYNDGSDDTDSFSAGVAMSF